MKQTIHDKHLGTVQVKKNLRAKRYIFRVNNGQIVATIPRGGSEQEAIQYMEKNREKLLQLLQKNPSLSLLKEGTKIQTYTFSVNIFRSTRANYYTSLKDGVLHIACPQDIVFEDTETQKVLNHFFKKALRSEAIRVLPERLDELAKKTGLNYSGISIRDSKTRWGSCSQKKHINLSLSLMFLPEHLIDYIILHELCHTVEMNHGVRFWELMDQVTNQKAKNYRSALRAYSIR